MIGGPSRPAGWRREWLGPALVLVVAGAITLWSQHVGRIPNPPAVLLLVVVFAAFHGGVRPGLVSAALACGYFALAFSRHGHAFTYTHDDLRRVLLWGVTVPVMAVMVGTLKARAVAAERAVARAAEAQFLNAFRVSPIGVILTRLADNQMIDANDAALAMLGYARAEVIGKTALELGLFADAGRRGELVRQLAAEGRVSNVDVDVVTRSGAHAAMLASVERVTVEGAPCMLSFLVDVTARRREQASLQRREDALRKAQHLEALGRLAGGVAHDFNNLLTVIGGNAALLAGPDATSETRAIADDIAAATARAAALTRQLLDFSRPSPQVETAIDLSRTIGALEPMLARTLGAELALVTALAPDVVVRINPGQLDRVIMNLTLNARDATRGGGTVTLTTARVELDADAATRLAPAARPGSWVTLSVSDTGSGMDAATRDRIFEPFFTTKALGGGAGLGLATVHGIVTAAGGFIVVDSTLGHGATFVVYLPAADASAPAPRGEDGVADGRGAVVLVVDDDPLVRPLTARLVADLGHAVVVADSAAAALDLIDREPRPIAAIVTDVVMPGMNGPALIAQLLPRRPHLKVLFVSGYANDDQVTRMLRPGQIGFLAKPFDRDALAHSLAALQIRPAAAGAA